jgi:DNA-binding CsgD family transcriptional regulator
VHTDQTKKLLTAITTNPAAPLRLALIAPGGYGKTTFLRELSGIPVVDDAHLLPGERLRTLTASRLVLACRPWPRPPELTQVLRTMTCVHLAPWDVDVVRQVVGSCAPEVYARTGGIPRWVARMAHDESLRYDLESLDPAVVTYLVAVHTGLGRRVDLVAELLPSSVEVMRAARASGFVAEDGTLVPLCAQAIARALPAEQYLPVLQRLAELQLARGETVLSFARYLIGSGATGPAVAEVLATAAREDPSNAAELYGAAVSAGRPLRCVRAEWARAAALGGDLDTALRLADQGIADGDRESARVAAAALAHRGQWGRSAELYRWAGATALAEVAAIATGDRSGTTGNPLGDAQIDVDGSLDVERPAAGAWRTGPPAEPASPGPVGAAGGVRPAGPPRSFHFQRDEPPTLLAGAATLMAQGLHLSLGSHHIEALSLLVRATTSLAPAGDQALLPDSPAALAAIVAIHCGELTVAESVLATPSGGAGMRTRHALLAAWIQMTRGNLAAAHQLITEEPREPRDRLVHVTLKVGLARRAGEDTTHLQPEVNDCLVSHPIDLFTLLPLAELVAARLHPPQALNHPPLWTTPLHWAGLQAALITENHERATEHIRGLAANRSPYGAALTEAATCWRDVTLGKVATDRVQQAAHRLERYGLAWESARLASEAAIRTDDHRAMAALLDCARQVRPQRVTAGDGPLSEREQDVADLIVQGMTHRQIGDKLYISAKTVEHHVARIRQRLGAANRSDLISRLQALRHP